MSNESSNDAEIEAVFGLLRSLDRLEDLLPPEALDDELSAVVELRRWAKAHVEKLGGRCGPA